MNESVYVVDYISNEEIRKKFRKRIAEDDKIFYYGAYKKLGNISMAVVAVVSTLMFYGINFKVIIDALMRKDFFVLILTIPGIFMFTLAYLHARTDRCYYAFTDKGVMAKDGIHQFFKRTQYISRENITRISGFDESIIVKPAKGKSIYIGTVNGANEIAKDLCEKYGIEE